MTIDNEICHDPKTIANYFKSFFTNEASNLVKKLPNASNVFTASSDFFKNFYISRNSQKTTFKVEDRVKQLRVNHVFKIFHEISPQYLNYSFVRVTDSQSYNTRGSDYNFRIPSINGCYTKTFYYNSILDWNNLPENIKSISNKETFKTAVKSYRLTAGQSEEARIFN